MKELNLLMIIARLKDHAAYEKYFSRHKLAAYAAVPCRGTAQIKRWICLALSRPKKSC